MTEKSIRTLSKLEMLEIMHQQEVEIERLNAERDVLLERLDERQISINKAGSLAEASLELSGVMTAAQDAADMYLQNVKTLENKKGAILDEIENEARIRTHIVYKEAVQRRAEAEAGAKAIIGELRKLFSFNFKELDYLQSEFDRMVNDLGIMDGEQSEKWDGTETEQ